MPNIKEQDNAAMIPMVFLFFMFIKKTPVFTGALKISRYPKSFAIYVIVKDASAYATLWLRSGGYVRG